MPPTRYRCAHRPDSNGAAQSSPLRGAEPTPAPSREAVLADEKALTQVLRQIQNTDPFRVRSLIDRLRQLGVTEHGLTLAGDLRSPNVAIRQKLIRDAQDEALAFRIALLLALTFDRDSRVRTPAVEALGEASSSPAVQARLRTIARSDPDEVVQGYAQLILAGSSGSQDVSAATSSLSRALDFARRRSSLGAAQAEQEAGLRVVEADCCASDSFVWSR